MWSRALVLLLRAGPAERLLPSGPPRARAHARGRCRAGAASSRMGGCDAPADGSAMGGADAADVPVAADDTGPGHDATRFTGMTVWTQRLRTPLQRFLRTEAGGAAVLVTGALLALVWANIDVASYERVWSTHLSIRLGDAEVSLTLRQWVNSGLMTFFFFVVGLEARREFDLGELRERRRFTLPLAAGLAGMVVPVAIYLAINAGGSAAHAWGAAMSTDTAFALGTLALLGRRVPGQVRAFLLTALVVDDVVALLVIGLVYSTDVQLAPLLVALGLLAVALALRAWGVRAGLVYAVVGVAMWLAVLNSGRDPIVVGLVAGLLTYAYNPRFDAFDRAAELFRRFREQPTPELARSAGAGLAASLSLNERLQQLWLPCTGDVIVPLFALANAGIVIDAGFLTRA